MVVITPLFVTKFITLNTPAVAVILSYFRNSDRQDLRTTRITTGTLTHMFLSQPVQGHFLRSSVSNGRPYCFGTVSSYIFHQICASNLSKTIRLMLTIYFTDDWNGCKLKTYLKFFLSSLLVPIYRL